MNIEITPNEQEMLKAILIKLSKTLVWDDASKEYSAKNGRVITYLTMSENDFFQLHKTLAKLS